MARSCQRQAPATTRSCRGPTDRVCHAEPSRCASPDLPKLAVWARPPTNAWECLGRDDWSDDTSLREAAPPFRLTSTPRSPKGRTSTSPSPGR